jgi:DNA invertase Pin-like site-specific DNA recombinase
MKKVVTLYPEKNNIPMYDRRLRVAAYCRVSTEHEEQDGSIELQEDYFRAVIDGNRNWTNAGIFSERTTGLKLKNRKQFNAMIRKCKSGKIDLILTKSISRFGRNTLDELKALQDLRILGVDVYFEQENLWLHDQQVQMLITLHCALAQNESENMSRNIRWGIRQGFKSGTSGFADFACYGYRQDENGNLIVHDTEAKIVQEIFEMRAAGFSLGKISEWLFENGKNKCFGNDKSECIKRTI